MTDSKQITKFERNLEIAQNNEKVVYYDYLSYKRAAGWWTGLVNDDWHRPTIIKKAKYNAEFLQKLPQYYFLGFPIKELLKSTYADGYCHACAVALSLYFKDFKIITCNLQTYANHYTIKSGIKIEEYEHTFLLIDLDGIKTVIDTTFGFITDFETYTNIFNPKNIRIITSEQLEKVKPYQYIKSLKEYMGSSLGFNEIYDEEKKEWYLTEEEQKYQNIIQKYMDMCRNYNNDQNFHLTDFINRCLFKTSNSQCHWHWKNHLQCKEIGNTKYEYPQINLSSLKDDEFDENLYSTYKDTIATNERILSNYHNQENSKDNNQVHEKTNVKVKVRNFINELKSKFI